MIAAYKREVEKAGAESKERTQVLYSGSSGRWEKQEKGLCLSGLWSRENWWSSQLEAFVMLTIKCVNCLVSCLCVETTKFNGVIRTTRKILWEWCGSFSRIQGAESSGRSTMYHLATAVV